MRQSPQQARQRHTTRATCNERQREKRRPDGNIPRAYPCGARAPLLPEHRHIHVIALEDTSAKRSRRERTCARALAGAVAEHDRRPQHRAHGGNMRIKQERNRRNRGATAKHRAHGAYGRVQGRQRHRKGQWRGRVLRHDGGDPDRRRIHGRRIQENGRSGFAGWHLRRRGQCRDPEGGGGRSKG